MRLIGDKQELPAESAQYSYDVQLVIQVLAEDAKIALSGADETTVPPRDVNERLEGVSSCGSSCWHVFYFSANARIQF